MLSLTEELKQTVRNASSKYIPADDRKIAVKTLAIFFAGVRKEVRQHAIREYFDRCNTILSQCSRSFSREWTDAKLGHETEQTLQEWLTGEVIGVIDGRTVVVTLNGVHIRLMDYAIASLMHVQSLGYSFKLWCDLDKKEVVISGVQTRPGFN